MGAQRILFRLLELAQDTAALALTALGPSLLGYLLGSLSCALVRGFVCHGLPVLKDRSKGFHKDRNALAASNAG
jgi:hypothetical protein